MFVGHIATAHRPHNRGGFSPRRHSLGNGNPAGKGKDEQERVSHTHGLTGREREWRENEWIPACAGMTMDWVLRPES